MQSQLIAATGSAGQSNSTYLNEIMWFEAVRFFLARLRAFPGVRRQTEDYCHSRIRHVHYVIKCASEKKNIQK